MADENVHVKVAMADVLGLVVLSIFTFLVAGFGLKAYGAGVIVSVAPFAGWVMLAVTIFAYFNENVLATAIFGTLAVLFLGFAGVAGDGGVSMAMFLGVIAIIFLIDGLVALAQPVKLLPILLFLGALSLLVTALWFNSPDDGTLTAFGALWVIFTLIAWYMAAAIMLLVLKGKTVLPLLIKA